MEDVAATFSIMAEEDDLGVIDFQKSPERPKVHGPFRGPVFGPILDASYEIRDFIPVFRGESEDEDVLDIVAYLHRGDLEMYDNLDEFTLLHVNPVIDELGYNQNDVTVQYEVGLSEAQSRRRYLTVTRDFKELMRSVARILLITDEGA